MAEYGYVSARVFTSRGQIPVENASVTVEKDDLSAVLGARITDENGKITPIQISTPSKEQSLTPGTINPFTRVNIRISHPDFYTYYVRDAQVFEGETSVQFAELIPIDKYDTFPYRLDDFSVSPQNL